MTNGDILALPDVIRALQCWWDETRSWAVGVTSGVIADLLEDHGWDMRPPDSSQPCGYEPFFRSLRGRHGLTWVDGGGGIFNDAAGVFDTRTGTTANPKVYRMMRWLWDSLRAEGVDNYALAKAHILVSGEDASRIASSREVRDYLMQGDPLNLLGGYESGNPLALFGMPCTILYGTAILYSESQTVGRIDMVAGDTIVTARTVP